MHFALGNGVAPPTNSMSRIEGDYLPYDHVIEERSKAGKVKLFRRLREVELFDIGRDVNGFNRREGEAVVFPPGAEGIGS